ncbi:MAG TPA: putative inorganic carbon transporter subunit DabA, partial [Humisphaera sp.]
MPEIMTNEAVKSDGASVEAVGSLVARVCARVAPLWDLPNYVAVNPFLGFTSRPLAEAARAVADGIGARVLPPVEFYRRRWREGGFGSTSLGAAADRHGLDPAALEAVLDGTRAAPVRPDGSVLSLAEQVDRAQGTRWHDALVRSTARWCAVYASDGIGGGGAWGPVAAGHGLFASWREAESVDRTLEIAGLKGWRKWVRRLPASAAEATALVLGRLDLPTGEREAYLYHLLGGLLGWASYFRRAGWAAGDATGGDVADLLAIRLCADVAVHELAPRTKPSPQPKPPAGVEDEATRAALQDALEDGYVTGLLGALNPPPAHKPARPAVQGVFCIDVRSEPFRRHLEAQSPAVETLGFAGFFGVSLDWQAGGEQSARCPVLLKPAVSLRATGGAPKSAGPVALKHLQAAPAGAFSVVETLGALYGVGLLRDAAVAGGDDNPAGGAEAFALDPDGAGAGLDLARRTDLAAGILKNTGLRFPLARVVLLCGHEGRSANNPHVAGLHCGACGGHGGAINARVAAAVLNDPAVRDGLRARGVDVPADTRFVAGVHDTSV